MKALYQRGKALSQRYEKVLWWMHSVYALGLGTSVALFAREGFERARYLALSLIVVWIAIFVFFHKFGVGRAQDQRGAKPGARMKFLALTYVLKNMYQGMLFFLLPFYFQAASFPSVNSWFFVFLVACAIVSTLDVVFDRVLMRWRGVAAGFYAMTLFATTNLVVPALLPNTRTLYSLLIAAALAAVGFWTLHVPLRDLSKRWRLGALAASMLAAMGVAYAARAYVPPVPMHVDAGGVGPMVLRDGRLAMEVTTLHRSVIRELQAVTDVVVPGGKGDTLHHVWRREGLDVHRFDEGMSHVNGPMGTVRLRSTLDHTQLPRDLTGKWTVDVVTEDGQLVGRVRFRVID